MVYASESYSKRDDLISDEDFDDDSSDLRSLSGSYNCEDRFYRRRRWTQRDMTNAFNAVKYQGMSLRGAAVTFNVPESTLRDRIHGRVSLDCSRPGPPTFFTCEEEKRMVDHILFMSKIGYPYTRTQVVELAGDMTKAVGRIAPFKYLNPSQAWFYAFLNRWPDLKNFLFGPRNNRKTRGVSGDSIQSYYELLDKVLTKYDIKNKADHIWVMDELSISCENQPPKIIPINIQRAQSNSYWTPSVSILGISSAAGDHLPPFLFYRGDTITNNMMQGSVRGTKFTTTPSGWINSDSYILWFMNHVKTQIVQRPILVLYDGHLQFISVRVLERARDEGILLFPLPPHPAYNHCLENTCFCSFQYCFERRLERYMEQNMRQQLCKNNIAPIITAAYQRALKPEKVLPIFEKLGICPFTNLATTMGIYQNPTTQDQSQVPFEVETEEDETQSVASSSNWTTGTLRHTSSGVHYQPQQGQQLYPAMVEHFTKKYGTVTEGGVRAMTASESLAKSRNALTPNHHVLSRRIQDYMGDRWANFQKSFNNQYQQNNSVKQNNSSNATLISSNSSTTGSKNGAATAVCHKTPSNRVPSLEVCQAKTTTVSFAAEDEAATRLLTNESASAELDEGEGPDFCGMCGQLEPPASSATESEAGAEETQVIDWTRCDFCNRWVHLNTVCSRGSIIGENDFMCKICNQQRQDSLPPSKKICPDEESLEEEIITFN